MNKPDPNTPEGLSQILGRQVIDYLLVRPHRSKAPAEQIREVAKMFDRMASQPHVTDKVYETYVVGDDLREVADMLDQATLLVHAVRQLSKDLL